ncbi:MAG: 6-bladed beta-propeller [Desulfobacterium sp.]|nr:6-bladed beta-propeller [Desulfobacterium sp.]
MITRGRYIRYMLKLKDRFGDRLSLKPWAVQFFFVMLIPTMLALTQGCYRQPNIKSEVPEMVWPKSSEKPRIRFLQTVSEPDDYQIRKGMFYRIMDYVAGFEAEALLVSPYGVEADQEGRLYVVDAFLKTVVVYDVKSNSYYHFDTGEKPLSSPIDIAVDFQRGNVYVTDSKTGAVFAYQDFGRKFIGFIGQGMLERPTGIAVNKVSSELLVVDTLVGDVLRFDLISHHFKGKFGPRDSSDSLHSPTHISVVQDGSVLVTDSLNFQVLKYDKNGNVIGRFGGAGDGPGYFSRPRGVAADSDGNVYVVDALFDNVQIFSHEGNLLMAFGEHGVDLGEFWLPAGIYIDGEDRIYVSDAYNKRIQIFQYLKEPISKRLKSVTPAKADVQKRTENTGFQLSPELQQLTFEIGSKEQ